jgi:hypothetical protein
LAEIDSRPLWRFGAFALGCAAFVIFVAPHPTLSSRNGVALRLGGLKVDHGYPVARAIVESTEGRPNVLAPEPVAAWIPTFHQHPYPLMGRSIYLMAFQSRAPEEIGRRAALSSLMDGQGDWPQGARMLAESIDRDQLAAIAFSTSHPQIEPLKSLLLDHGYQRTFADNRYEVWGKPRNMAVSSSPAHLGSRVQ